MKVFNANQWNIQLGAGLFLLQQLNKSLSMQSPYIHSLQSAPLYVHFFSSKKQPAAFLCLFFTKLCRHFELNENSRKIEQAIQYKN